MLRSRASRACDRAQRTDLAASGPAEPPQGCARVSGSSVGRSQRENRMCAFEPEGGWNGFPGPSPTGVAYIGEEMCVSQYGTS
jgi:hypothetical protein